jgi:hypothetical protein
LPAGPRLVTTEGVRSGCVVATIGAAIAVIFQAVPASGDQATQCVRESERAQVVRDEGKFLEARDLFRACAREQCPRPVRKDCAEFASELETRIPSIVLSARDERGKDLARVRVTMDTQPLASEISARAVQVDPGSHVFRFEADGRKPVETTVIVREGEKNRIIDAALAPLGEPALAKPPPPPPRVEPPPPPPEEKKARGVPTMTWVFGGIALAGAGTFGVLSGLAVDQAKGLERSCAPRCSDAEIEPVETKFLIGRIAGGVAIAAAASAILFYVLGREPASPRAKSNGSLVFAF